MAQNDRDLPLDVVPRGAGQAPHDARTGRLGRIVRRLLPIPVLLFTGAVIGLYFQPPGVQKFFEWTGLQPGAGTSAPIALPPEINLPQDVVDTLQFSDVVGLARLIPRGDVVTVAPPFGAGDARVAQLLVGEGDTVTAGQVVARLDNLAQLEAAVQTAEAAVAVREAALDQTRAAIANSLAEAQASLEQAEAAAEAAQLDFNRTTELFARNITTQAVLDAAEATNRQAARAVDRARATLSRYVATEIDAQPDVIVAQRNLDAARVDLDRARSDLERAEVRAPINGVILETHVRAGEKPGQDGILAMGDTAEMTAEVEIYQDRIALVEVGQPVELVAQAIGETLVGHVDRIGLTVGRQSILSDDTAANTDARVVTVQVTLDAASSAIASRYTNLEVVARIDTRAGLDQ
jgi:HlyD family secretion protein